MVEPMRYTSHLKTGTEIKQVGLLRRINSPYFDIILFRNLCAPITRQSTMSILPKHTLHPQELVQLHVPDMGVFSPTVL